MLILYCRCKLVESGIYNYCYVPSVTWQTGYACPQMISSATCARPTPPNGWDVRKLYNRQRNRLISLSFFIGPSIQKLPKMVPEWSKNWNTK